MKAPRIFDNGGETFDRYTLITPDDFIFGFSSEPFHPQGFGQFCGEWQGGSTRHLGKKVTIESLPINAQKYVKHIMEGN